MENEASYRDQVQYACSAQNAKLLPKRKSSPQKAKQAAAQALKSQVGGIFESWRRQNEQS